MSGVDKPIMDKAAELFGWAYGLGGFDVAVLEFVTFVRAQSDTRIAELERQLNSDKLIKMVTELRAELAAIKAQEPVAYIPVDRETGEEWHPVLKKGSGNICDYKPLYAAPAAPAADALIEKHKISPHCSGICEWVDATNKYVSGTDLCLKCGALRAQGVV